MQTERLQRFQEDLERELDLGARDRRARAAVRAVAEGDVRVRLTLGLERMRAGEGRRVAIAASRKRIAFSPRRTTGPPASATSCAAKRTTYQEGL